MTRAELGVLVGVDGSEQSLRAADWAVADAAAAGRRLTVCYVSDVWVLADVPLPPAVRHEACRFGQRVVDRALARVRRQAGAVPAVGLVAEGNPAAELLRVAAGAEQVVLGSRGAGGFEKLVLGSVGAEVAAHAPCPVVVIRGEGWDRREVVVGVDASQRSDRALEYAFGYAGRHGMTVHAVHAGHEHTAPLSPVSARSAVPQEEGGAGRELLADAVTPWALKYPRVRIETAVVDGSAAWTLTQASRGAALVVVGSRGHGGFAGLLLGSVSQALLRHADCPVAVVR
jgi:nucleotide-binding universal stress UspA family protein